MIKPNCFGLFIVISGMTAGTGVGSVPRPVTVADGIAMTRAADVNASDSDSPNSVAHFSPDGGRFILLLEKGNLERNTVDYSIYLFPTANVSNSSKPKPLLTMASSSNRPAIMKIKWLSDNKTIVFLGENPGELPQVYEFDVDARHLIKLTNHPLEIAQYSISGSGQELLFTARPPLERTDTVKSQREGIVIKRQYLAQILEGSCRIPWANLYRGEELYSVYRGQAPSPIPADEVVLLGSNPAVSQDGRFAIIQAQMRNIPKEWNGYEDTHLKEFLTEKRENGQASWASEYMLLDVKDRKLLPLLDTPMWGGNTGFVWSPDGRSVIISGAYLPLSVTDPVERDTRTKKQFVVEVSIPGREITKISEKEARVSRWDPFTNRILLTKTEQTGWNHPVPAAMYEKKGRVWEEVAPTPESTAASSRLDVKLEQGINAPPRIFVSDPKTQKKSLLLDLNPQFAELRFGRVETIAWKSTDGYEIEGGLYFPPDYVPGKRYPLVIQTHGYDKSSFAINGPFNSAFAAQALAGKGFLVLQGHMAKPGDERLEKAFRSPEEGPNNMARYEGAIDHLDQKGMIDRNRVGIIGFSRTVFHVLYTLTHSKYRFAAATIADGMDGGYFTYIINTGSDSNNDGVYVNGGPPFGETLSSWLKNSPSFNVDKLQAPLRIEAYYSWSVMQMWEWFSALTKLSRPVDFIYLPEATHVLVKPSEQMASQQGNVDWFGFWLQGYEDPDQEKGEQYRRWEKLCDLQVEQNPSQPAFCVRTKTH